MEIKEVKSVESYRNTFNQTAYEEVKKNEIKCTKEEFMDMLGKKENYMIVNIKRNAKSEFLFENSFGDPKYATLNIALGLESMSYADWLDRNDRVNDILEII